MLIGFSWGANSVRHMANRLNDQGVQIDLLVYLVGDMVCDKAESRPSNVCRVAHFGGVR